jgi:hypothetical protein
MRASEPPKVFSNYERELAIQERIELLGQEFASVPESLPAGAFIPSDALVAMMVELDELHNELRVLRGDSLDSDEPDSLIRIPLKPGHT